MAGLGYIPGSRTYTPAALGHTCIAISKAPACAYRDGHYRSPRNRWSFRRLPCSYWRQGFANASQSLSDDRGKDRDLLIGHPVEVELQPLSERASQWAALSSDVTEMQRLLRTTVAIPSS